ncbi:MAG: transposase [Bacteroidota bacterium]
MPRKSTMHLGEVYFWTSTIYQWKHLLKPDKYKQVIVESLDNLCQRSKIKVYGFVIMPNHIHVLWEMLEMNGREMPYASFQKYTAHFLQTDLRSHHPTILDLFYVAEKERVYRFWERDPLAIKIESRLVAEQKLTYIHHNPLQAHWNLATSPEAYSYSSAGYYEKETSGYPFLTHYVDRFG